MSNLAADDPTVVSTIRDSYLLPPSKLPYNLSTDSFYLSRSTSYNWPFVQNHLKILFENEPPGFFIEAGAFDGEFLSNTLWLEKDLGWTGLLVEPEPRNFHDLVAKRRKSWISNTCLSDVNHAKVTVMVSMEKHDRQRFDPEAVRGGAHIKGAHDGDKIYSSFEKVLKTQDFESQCFPLYSYLLALGVSVVDFLSLDVQGPEIEIIFTLPFDKIYLRALAVEHERKKIFDINFVKRMNDKGFIIIDVGGSPDYFFVNKMEKKLIKKYKKKLLQELVDNDFVVKLYGNRTAVETLKEFIVDFNV